MNVSGLIANWPFALAAFVLVLMLSFRFMVRFVVIVLVATAFIYAAMHFGWFGW